MYKLKALRIFAVLLMLLSLAGPSGSVLARPLAQAVTPTVGLGTAGGFAVLAGSGITNTLATTISGDVGSSPTSTETGFGSITLSGANHNDPDPNDAVTQAAKNDLTSAYTDAAGRVFTVALSELGSTIKLPGVYKNTASSDFQITGVLTLDAQGDPNAVFIFQSDSTLITASNSSVSLINGAQACNVFWQVGSSATLGTGSNFQGTIMAQQAITDNGGSTINGRLLASVQAVTLNNTNVFRSVCAAAVIPAVVAGDGGSDGGGSDGASSGNGTRSIVGLPNTGGAPIRNDDFPWVLLFAGSLAITSLVLGVRSYCRTRLLK